MTMTALQIDDLAEEALNSACLAIQTRLGVDDGGFASMFFSDNEVKSKFIEYIKAEIHNYGISYTEDQS